MVVDNKKITLDLITADELGELFRLSYTKVLVLVKRDHLPAYRISGKLRFNPEEVAEWLESRREYQPGVQ